MTRQEAIVRKMGPSQADLQLKKDIHTSVVVALIIGAMAFASIGCAPADYGNDDGRDNKQDARLANLEGRVRSIENAHSYAVAQIQSLTNTIEQQTAMQTFLNSELSDLRSSADADAAAIASLQNQIAVINQNLVSMQASVAVAQNTANSALMSIAALNMNVQVTGIVDPCNDGPGFDEVLIKTSAGYVAYFEQGQGQGNQERFLTLLTPGSYRTTDSQACNFTVTASNQLIY